MQLIRGIASALMLLLTISATAQTYLDRLVTVSYEDVVLQQVLYDLQTRYQVPFSYSSDLVELATPVRAEYRSAALRVVLDDVSMQAGIGYVELGGMIVLRNERPAGGQLSAPEVPLPLPHQEEEEILFTGTPPWKQPGLLVSRVPVSSVESVSQLPKEPYWPGPHWGLLDSLEFAGQKGRTVLQASIVPYLGNYLEYSDQVTANLSFNLIWGVTGGINGVELGLGVNVTQGTMRGFQMSGITNVVTGPVYGMQLTGGINVAEDRTVGLQIAGIGNFSRLHDGVQLSSLLNVTAWRATGLQVSGLMNIAGGRYSVVGQVSGLLNFTRGQAKWQAASLLNVASEVRGGQVGLLNIGGDVGGFQLGLINISDTISGPSIGLLNFVRRGYNRYDLSTSEVFWGQTGVALGSPHFYNLFQIGYRGTDGRANASWGLGYGLGTRIGYGKRWQTNLELFAWHVNEEQVWTSRMNWLFQGRLLFEKHAGFLRHLYFGPIFNLSASSLRPTENGTLGTKLAPYNLLPDSPNHSNGTKAWVGFQAGFRF